MFCRRYLPLFLNLKLFTCGQSHKKNMPNGRQLRSRSRSMSSRALLIDIDCEEHLRIAVNLWLTNPDLCTHVYGHISDWEVSKVRTMRGLFANVTESFNEDLSRWDVSNMVDMSFAFQNAKSFDVDLSKWDVSNVKYMNNMFQGATKFNSNMTHWNTEKVLSFAYQFEGASSFNGDISNWDVTNSYDLSYMFHNAVNFNSNISTWMITQEKNNQGGIRLVWQQNLESMFQNATSFNGDLSKWETWKVAGMKSIFEGASSFDSDLSSWNVHEVENMSRMFAGASSYHSHNLCWHVNDSPKKIDTTDMFLGTSNNTLDGEHCPSSLPASPGLDIRNKKTPMFTERKSFAIETILAAVLIALLFSVVVCVFKCRCCCNVTKESKLEEGNDEEEGLTFSSGSEDEDDEPFYPTKIVDKALLSSALSVAERKVPINPIRHSGEKQALAA